MAKKEELFPSMQSTEELIKTMYDKGFNDAKNKVLDILREVGDLGDGDYVWDAVNSLGEDENG